MRARRGSALILVLLMTLAVAGLAVAAIFMSSSAGLLSRFYDREREFRMAAESAIELVRTRLVRDSSLAVPDTGMVQLFAGLQIRDANGTPLPRARVHVYAATTGDTTGRSLPHVTLIAASYDASGMRHVRRADLRRESFSRFSMFVDSFPSGTTHGPGLVDGRVHTNDTWRGSLTGNRYRDTVSATVGFEGAGTFDIDSLVGGVPIHYPKDSTFAWMHTLAGTANLSFTPVSGGGRASRIEFVSFDADGDGTVEEAEGFARVFDLANVAGIDTSRFRVDPAEVTPLIGGSASRYLTWSDPIIQNQCGAFYRFDGRWHFFPVATHRANYVRNALTAGGAGRYPVVSGGMMNRLDDYTYAATEEILLLPTARCFPAGSPYLMPAERLTNAAGVVTGTAADVLPWGRSAPPGGWPASAPNGYGGSDTTFTEHVRACTFPTVSDPAPPWACTGPVNLGSWRTFPVAWPWGAVPAAVRQAGELNNLWPLSPPYNTTSRGVVSSAGPVYVSGDVRGRVTLRVAGRASIIDRLRLHNDPNDPALSQCADQLGLLAVGDVLVLEGMTSRVRRIGESALFGLALGANTSLMLGGEPRFTLQGTFMSLTGTVGVENSSIMMGATTEQLPCPEDGAASTETNGGCFALTGSAIMRRYSPLGSATAYSGYRLYAAPDACQATERRPPFFPLTNRYRLERTLEIEPSLANTPARIRTILMRLKGRAL
jgi:hypothetical protein